MDNKDNIPVPACLVGAEPWLADEFVKWFREESPKLPLPPPEYYDYARTAPVEDLLSDLLDFPSSLDSPPD